MGEPATLSEAQLAFLRETAVPGTRAQTVENGAFTLTLGPNAVLHFTLNPAPLTPDLGYEYGWYAAEE